MFNGSPSLISSCSTSAWTWTWFTASMIFIGRISMLLIGLSMPLVTIMFMPKMFTVNNPMRLLSACLQWHHEPAPHAMTMFPPCVSFITFDRQSSILLRSFAIRIVINVIIIIGCHPAPYLFRASIAISCGYQRLRLSVCAVHRLVVRWFHWTHPTWRFSCLLCLSEFHATVKWRTGNIINRNEYHEWFQCALPMPWNNVVLPVPPLSSMMNTWTFRVGATDSNNAIMASACSLSLSLTECILHKLDALINNHLAWLFRLPVPMHCLTMACVQWNHFLANVLWDYHQWQGHWPWFESHVIWFHASVSSVLWFPFREWHVHNGIIKLTASAVIAESLNSIEWRIIRAYYINSAGKHWIDFNNCVSWQ